MNTRREDCRAARARLYLGWSLLAVLTVPVRAQEDVMSQVERQVAAVAKAATPSVVLVRAVEGPAVAPGDEETAEGWTRLALHRSQVGTGFVSDRDGIILTSSDVVGAGEKVEIETSDGRKLEGKVLGSDGATGVAVAKVEGTDLPVLRFAEEESAQPGQWAIVVGQQVGGARGVAGEAAAPTVSFGTVGRTDATLANLVPQGKLLQIQTAVGPGASGAPVLNAHGDVIGMVVAASGPVLQWSDAEQSELQKMIRNLTERLGRENPEWQRYIQKVVESAARLAERAAERAKALREQQEKELREEKAEPGKTDPERKKQREERERKLERELEQIEEELDQQIERDLKPVQEELERQLERDLKPLEKELQQKLRQELEPLEKDLEQKLQRELEPLEKELEQKLKKDLEPLEKELEQKLKKDLEPLEKDLRQKLESDPKPLDGDLRRDIEKLTAQATEITRMALKRAEAVRRHGEEFARKAGERARKHGADRDRLEGEIRQRVEAITEQARQLAETAAERARALVEKYDSETEPDEEDAGRNGTEPKRLDRQMKRLDQERQRLDDQLRNQREELRRELRRLNEALPTVQGVRQIAVGFAPEVSGEVTDAKLLTDVPTDRLLTAPEVRVWAGASPGRGGVTYAVPAPRVRWAMQEIRERGRVTRGFLGVMLSDLKDEDRARLKAPEEAHVRVLDVVPDGPAQKAGIRKDDLLLEFREKKLDEASDLLESMAEARAGDKVPVVIWRDGERRTLEVTLGERRAHAVRALRGLTPPQPAPRPRLFRIEPRAGEKGRSVRSFVRVSPSGRVAASVVGTGRSARVSLDARDAELAEVLGELSRATGLELSVEGEAARRRVTLKVEKVSVDDLVESLNRLYNLRSERKGDRLLFRTR